MCSSLFEVVLLIDLLMLLPYGPSYPAIVAIELLPSFLFAGGIVIYIYILSLI